MRLVSFGSDHPLTRVALELLPGVPEIEHVEHIKTSDARLFLRAPASAAFRAHLVTLEPDLLLSAGYGRVLPADVLATARLGAINVHPSLLPAYRGYEAVSWALYEGRSEVGVTIHEMIADVDSGPILAQTRLPVDPRESPGIVFGRVREAAGPLLRQTLEEIMRADCVAGRPQSGTASYRSKPWREVDRLEIDWTKPAQELIRRGRIFPEHANIPVGSWRIFVRSIARAGSSDERPGTILRRRYSSIDVAVGERGVVRLPFNRPLRAWAKLLLTHNLTSLDLTRASMGRAGDVAAPSGPSAHPGPR